MVLIQLYKHNYDPERYVHIGILLNKFAVYYRHGCNHIDIFYPHGNTYKSVLVSLNDDFTTKVNQCN